MNSKLYKHKKTGKLYSLVQKNIKVKCDAVFLENTNETVFDWEHNYTKGRVRADMIKKAKEILAAMDAEMVSEGKIPQVTYIFRAKNFFGMQDQQELVLTPNNKLGDEVNEQEIVDKYKKSLPKASD